MTFKQLRTVAPELPTLSDALAFFAEEATTVGIHIDLPSGISQAVLV